jgi:hypothetical protein
MEEKSDFKEFGTRKNPITRKSLLPGWIKFFSWLFLLVGIAAVLILAFGFFLNGTTLSLYGLKTDQSYSITGFIVCYLYIFKGIVSYGLLFGKEWAPVAAIIDAVIGIIICIVMMAVVPFISETIHFTIRLELIPLYYYITKMLEIRKTWLNI